MTEKELMEFRFACLALASSLRKMNDDGLVIDNTNEEILEGAEKFYKFVSTKG